MHFHSYIENKLLNVTSLNIGSSDKMFKKSYCLQRAGLYHPMTMVTSNYLYTYHHCCICLSLGCMYLNYSLTVSVPFIGVGGVNNPAAINLMSLNDSSLCRAKPQKESKWASALRKHKRIFYCVVCVYI